MIEISKIKFVHKFTNNRLPFSFTNCWIKNSERFPNRQLRNADDLYITTHHFESIKRLPLFSFPFTWNQAENEKFNPNEKTYLKHLKFNLLQNLPV